MHPLRMRARRIANCTVIIEGVARHFHSARFFRVFSIGKMSATKLLLVLFAVQCALVSRTQLPRTNPLSTAAWRAVYAELYFLHDTGQTQLDQNVRRRMPARG